MALSHKDVGPKILAKIKIYILTRAELIFNLCYEIPCRYQFLKNLCQFLLILDLWGITFQAVVVIGLGNDLLFRSVLGQ